MWTAARPSLRRILLLDQLLRAGRYPNARTAARELEVHPRTVARDLEFMREFYAKGCGTSLLPGPHVLGNKKRPTRGEA
jgi:predicted DNA-binding transcriptional regulator YafY